jgi:hypothetical protein
MHSFEKIKSWGKLKYLNPRNGIGIGISLICQIILTETDFEALIIPHFGEVECLT